MWRAFPMKQCGRLSNKRTSYPWLNQSWVIPPEANAEFVCQMQDLLDIDPRAYDPQHPVVGFTES